VFSRALLNTLVIATRRSHHRFDCAAVDRHQSAVVDAPADDGVLQPAGSGVGGRCAPHVLDRGCSARCAHDWPGYSIASGLTGDPVPYASLSGAMTT
jgi:hypothetical protein